jgi:putative transcriptional regulator
VFAVLLAVPFAGPDRLHAEPIELGKGLFLIAEPALRDPNFRETVILITHHDVTGTMGVVINRPTATPLSHLLPDRAELEGRTETLYLGGPVERSILVLLVRMRSEPEHAHRVFDNVYLTQSTDVLGDALNSDDPSAGIRLFAGYAGWAPGQLADEIAAGGWRVVPADASVVFDRDADLIWKEMIRRTSEHYI